MDAINTALGLSYRSDAQPRSLVEWNAQYEALSLENDWWFKAAVAVARWVRSGAAAISTPTAPVPQIARA